MTGVFSSRTYKIFDDPSIIQQYQKHILFRGTWMQGQAQRGEGINQPGCQLQRHCSGITTGSQMGKKKLWFRMTKLQFISSANYSSSSAACDIESGACQRAKLDPEKAAMGSISGTSSGSHASPCKKEQGREETLERRMRR